MLARLALIGSKYGPRPTDKGGTCPDDHSGDDGQVRQKGCGMTKIRTSTLFTKHELQNPSHDYLRANIFLDVTIEVH